MATATTAAESMMRGMGGSGGNDSAAGVEFHEEYLWNRKRVKRTVGQA